MNAIRMRDFVFEIHGPFTIKITNIIKLILFTEMKYRITFKDSSPALR